MSLIKKQYNNEDKFRIIDYLILIVIIGLGMYALSNFGLLLIVIGIAGILIVILAISIIQHENVHQTK